MIAQKVFLKYLISCFHSSYPLSITNKIKMYILQTKTFPLTLKKVYLEVALKNPCFTILMGSFCNIILQSHKSYILDSKKIESAS